MLTTSEESTGYEKITKSRMQLYNFCFNGDHKSYRLYTSLTASPTAHFFFSLS